MSQRITRVRWNAEERAAVMMEVASLRASQPTRSIAELFKDAQLKLPPLRRRRFNPTLRVWLDREFETLAKINAQQAALGRVATPAGVDASAGAHAASEVASATVDGTAPRLPAAVSPGSGDAHELQANLAGMFAELGSRIVVMLLRDGRVHEALRDALAAVASPPLPADRPTANDSGEPRASNDPNADAGPPANGRLRVLIAGIEPSQRAMFKTYEDTLDLHCWSAEQGMDLLRQVIDQADVVIGMAGALSQPVERTLRHGAKRYIGHSRGLPGLRSELASLALQGR